jgi:prepilin-type N-terminal cleavage/methylation domain-containing protein
MGWRMRYRRGLTILEVLVVIAVVAILMGLALPPIIHARRSARELRCVSNTREIGRLVAAYCAESRDVFPCYLPDGPRQIILQGESPSTRYARQVYSGLRKREWLEFCGLDRNSEIWCCPANQRVRLGGVRGELIDYWTSASVFVHPKYLDPLLPFQAWSWSPGAKIQTQSSVLFPSVKAGLYEHTVWHGWRNYWGPGVSVMGLMHTNSDRPGSVGWLDGHASLFPASDALPWADRNPHWISVPLATTAWGIMGRDRQ